MQPIDKIIFGDNQFFGINHMSQEKAQQLSEKFYDIHNIFKIYDKAIAAGIQAFMLNSNDRANEICDYFRDNEIKYGYLHWYPSIPYPHKYANMISEKGILSTLYEILYKGNTTSNIFGIIGKGSNAIFKKDVIKLMQMLIDIEMRIFKRLKVKTIFLQNIVTDLLLGYGIKEVFMEYCDYIRNKYNVIPGLITQNLPVLKEKLVTWNIKEVVICTSFNKIGYLMSPDVQSYINVASENNPNNYQIVAMSTLASGAIPVKEAFEFISKQKIQSVVFGASTENHIKEIVGLLSNGYT